MQGFSLEQLFIEQTTGETTTKDDLLVKFDRGSCTQLREDLLNLKEHDLRTIYPACNDSRDRTSERAIADLKKELRGTRLLYFRTYIVLSIVDTCFIQGTTGIMGRPRFPRMGALIGTNNYALCAVRRCLTPTFRHCFLASDVLDIHLISDCTAVFPLYKLPDGWNYTPAELVAGKTRNGIPIELEFNMCPEILTKISEAIGEPVKGE